MTDEALKAIEKRHDEAMRGNSRMSEEILVAEDVPALLTYARKAKEMLRKHGVRTGLLVDDGRYFYCEDCGEGWGDYGEGNVSTETHRDGCALAEMLK